MPDLITDLEPLTALGGVAPRSAAFGELTLRENAGLALASLALRKGQVTPAPFGLALPDVGGTVYTAPYGAFWMGQGQWMISADGLGDTDFATSLKTEVPEMSVTEQTDGFVAFDIQSQSGAAPIHHLMNKLVNIDPKTLGSGQATRTGLEHMTVFLIRHSEVHLTVLGMRSLAGSLWHALTVAADRLED